MSQPCLRLSHLQPFPFSCVVCKRTAQVWSVWGAASRQARIGGLPRMRPAVVGLSRFLAAGPFAVCPARYGLLCSSCSLWLRSFPRSLCLFVPFGHAVRTLCKQRRPTNASPTCKQVSKSENSQIYIKPWAANDAQPNSSSKRKSASSNSRPKQGLAVLGWLGWPLLKNSQNRAAGIR